MKICTKCGTEKNLNEYHNSSARKDGKQSACKTCMKVSYTRSRGAKLDHYKGVQADRNKRYALRFQQWKEQQKCALCEESTPCCLDLHHLDPAQKEVTISNVVQYWSWKRLKMEIDKCIVVCSNCHRKIHAGMIHLGVA